MAGSDKPPPRATMPLAEWDAEDAELLRGLFLEEAEDHLRQIAGELTLLARAAEQGEGVVSADAVDGLFRHLHTLKGAAGSVGFGAMSHASQELEDLCAEMRAGSLAPTPGILERFGDGVAGLRALLDGAHSAPRKTGGERAPRVERPGDRRRGPDRRGFGTRRHGERTVRVDSERLDAMLDGIGDLVILRTRAERRVRELEGVLRDLGAARGGLRTALGALGSAGPPRSDERETALHRDRLLDGLGEIEVEFTDAIAYLERATKALAGETEIMRRTTDHLDDQLRRARLVPLDWVYGRLGTALRTLEKQTHRPADLVVTGGEIELDKSVVEQLQDPLLHLLRNAVAHGIEPASERAARGKPERGRIAISARQDGEFVFLRFEDDGRGIEREDVRRALVRGGRLAADAPLSDELLMSAIFEPGFSSRASSDEIAGRGMGLNIVKRALMRLGGDVQVEYQPGAFTRIRLTVPLTAAITQALLFKVGGQVYAVPAAHVVEALPVDPQDGMVGNARRDGADGARARDRGPVLRLHALLGVEVPPGKRATALHIRYGERAFVVTCDRIIGPRTIVVRPLGPLLDGLPLFAGVTISGAGKAQLVLDLGALADAAYTQSRGGGATARRGPPRVLLVDDSRLGRESAARVLTSASYSPVVAEDGWEAWEMLSERRFDAVITDLEMPRMDGFELIVRIRREPTLRGLPILVYSSRTSTATRARALAAGADAVLPKVPGKRGLPEALAQLLEGASARSRATGDGA